MKRLKAEEEIVLKKLNQRNKIMFLFIVSVLGMVIIPPLYRRDPVDFWMYVIVGICMIGLIAMRKKR